MSLRNMRSVGLLRILLGVTLGAGLATVMTMLLHWAAPTAVAFEVLPEAVPATVATQTGYILLVWNDLGMHCYNADYQYLATLPPGNTLWAQVLQVGDPPQIITTGITVTYSFADNTYSVGKTNFWDYDQLLFGVDLPPNVGLAGKGLSGTMDVYTDHFAAEGIPLTEFGDSAPTTPNPYQLATVVVWDAESGQKLAETTAVAPTSSEMNCAYCHYDEGVEGIATGNVERNILALHDQRESTTLVQDAPVLCATCHASNALPDVPMEPGQRPNLSQAIHAVHAEGDVGIPDGIDGCYLCHPGANTRCLRDVMSQPPYDMECTDCHGTLMEVADAGRIPWLEEPSCADSGCHDDGQHDQDAALYRLSTGHGGVYCAGCHDSPHAIAPSREAADSLKFIALQGYDGPLNTCATCHVTSPASGGPHGSAPPVLVRDFILKPDRSSFQEPGSQVVYTHTLSNIGHFSDTYEIVWSSSQDWSALAVIVGGGTLYPPVTLQPGEEARIEVTVSIPNTETVRGQSDRTVVTATSMVSPALQRYVTDVTHVPVQIRFVYLPLILKR